MRAHKRVCVSVQLTSGFVRAMKRGGTYVDTVGKAREGVAGERGCESYKERRNLRRHGWGRLWLGRSGIHRLAAASP